jgi:hypothetical protein
MEHRVAYGNGRALRAFLLIVRPCITKGLQTRSDSHPLIHVWLEDYSNLVHEFMFSQWTLVSLVGNLLGSHFKLGRRLELGRRGNEQEKRGYFET